MIPLFKAINFETFQAREGVIGGAGRGVCKEHLSDSIEKVLFILVVFCDMPTLLYLTFIRFSSFVFLRGITPKLSNNHA